MIETSDSTDEVVLDRLRETLDGAIRDPSHSLASMMTEAYRSLLRMAHVQRNTFGVSPTLSTTALVHEVYLKLQESPNLKVSDIHHFHYLAIRAMRFVLTDHARRKLAQKRGSAVPTETLDEHAGSDTDDRHAEQVIELNEAIDQLGQIFPRMAQIVSLRFYIPTVLYRETERIPDMQQGDDGHGRHGPYTPLLSSHSGGGPRTLSRFHIRRLFADRNEPLNAIACMPRVHRRRAGRDSAMPAPRSN